MFTLLLSSLLTNYHNSCIIFFTGGSNLISPNIYSDFLNKFNNYNVPIYKIPFNTNNNIKTNTNIIRDLHKNYEEIIMLGHSSGCTTLLNNCKTINNIDKIVLLDPVVTPFINRKNDYSHLKKVLIINAEKSYKWSKIPPFLPFIPIFRLKLQDLGIELNKIKLITVKKYGHSDLINKPYRNIMHYSRISLGHDKREDKYIDAYHNFLIKFNDVSKLKCDG